MYGINSLDIQFQYKAEKGSSSQCSPVKEKIIPHKVQKRQLEKNSNITSKNTALNKIKQQKIIRQRELKPTEILEKIKNDPDFTDIHNYAKELGFVKLNKSMEVTYDTGNNTEMLVTLTTLVSDNQTISFLIKYSSKNTSTSIKKSHLAKFENQNGTPILTLFDREGGVKIDLLNGSVISSWGPHGSCGWWTCLSYFNEYALETGWLYQNICGAICALCIPSIVSPLFGDEVAVCGACLTCMIGIGAVGVTECTINNCAWYPCLEDCDDRDGYYGSSWEYYCDGNNRMKHRLYYDYYCSSSTPRQGSCVYDADYVDDTCDTCPCPYGCNELTDNCKGAITCYGDGDCGDSGWIGSPSCSGNDVWQNWREYTCYNPGTESSYCDYDDDYILKQECTSGECSSGECVGSESCENPNYPWWCDGDCYSCPEDSSLCCPDSGEAEWCCYDTGPYCESSTGECTICGGDYPWECNDGCWGCPEGGELCCPTSGDPEWCCYTEIGSVCMSNGDCCLPYNETCNNEDDDCDTVIDSFDEGCGTGACANGIRTCTAGSWGSCSTAGLATSETCNNVDDDCDGSVDESLSQECGIDEGACVKGTQTCSAGNWSACGGSYVGPVNETCNGIDDNCNNITDEQNVCNRGIIINLEFPENNAVEYNTSHPTFGFNITNVNYTGFDCDLWLDNGIQSIYGNKTIWINVGNSWNLTANKTVSDGVYSWWMNCTDGVNWNVSEKRVITIGEPPSNPTILYPNGGETIDTSTIINWTESVDVQDDYVSYFLQYSNNSGTNWYDIVLNYGYENKLNDSSTEKNVTFSGNENQTIYLRLPKNAMVLDAKLDLTGLE